MPESLFVDLSDLRLHVASMRSGHRPMVLLHGIGMDWKVWQAISRRLAPKFSLFMVDLRGHGQSDKPDHGYTLAHYAADIEDLMDALSLSRAVLVGSSLGGMIAAVVEAPTDLVSHRILVDPPITNGHVRDATMFSNILRLKHESTDALCTYLRSGNRGIGTHLAWSMAEMWRQSADGVIEEMLAMPDDYFAIDDALAVIDAPTLLMRADPARSASLSQEQAQRALALLPRGDEVVVPGAGHAIHAYKPQEFVSLIENFVRTK